MQIGLVWPGQLSGKVKLLYKKQLNTTNSSNSIWLNLAETLVSTTIKAAKTGIISIRKKLVEGKGVSYHIPS